ncbi:MAG: FAD-dependent oxidoreductase [Acidobacteriaceae bacterium]
MTALNVQIEGTRNRDVVVVGAGIIGLSLALALNDRGAEVTVLDRWRSLTGASIAAAGMLAAEDPCNPLELLSLSRLSIERYPSFLRQVETLSGTHVPFQTERTLQSMADGSTIRLPEHSIDPRQLAVALRAAIASTPIELMEETQIASVENSLRETKIRLASGVTIAARSVVFAAGAWTSEAMMAFGEEPVHITPRKGQMLRVRLPSGLALNEVRRNERVYIVPRTHGPQAGTALIGATVEDAGFDTDVHKEDLDALRALAAKLVPALGPTADAPMVESWAGLRPATPDLLPALGACVGDRTHAGRFVASGHYRNGILLAPATAAVMADLIEGKAPSVDLAALSPLRFSAPVMHR